MIWFRKKNIFCWWIYEETNSHECPKWKFSCDSISWILELYKLQWMSWRHVLCVCWMVNIWTSLIDWLKYRSRETHMLLRIKIASFLWLLRCLWSLFLRDERTGCHHLWSEIGVYVCYLTGNWLSACIHLPAFYQRVIKNMIIHLCSDRVCDTGIFNTLHEFGQFQ